MKLYGGIDLHADNNVIALLDEHDKVMYEKRLPNDMPTILHQLAPYQSTIAGLVLESTYNWYWLADGLMEADYVVHLANTAATTQYEGLKFTNDQVDARWLAHLLRLGILPEGYIYPKAERAVRDLLRKRAQLVRQKVTQILSMQTIITRQTGKSISANRIRQLTEEDVERQFPEAPIALAVKSNLAVCRCLEAQINTFERAVLAQTRKRPTFQLLKTVPGIGDILALTILLETGDIRRFATVGHFAS